MRNQTATLQITTEPLDDLRCKFIVSQPVAESGVQKYTSLEEAEDSPVAQAVLDVPGICEVVLSGNVITAVQDGSMPWTALDPQVRYAIEAGMSAAAPSAPSAPSALEDDDSVYDLVSDLFDREINPAVAQHGGKVELIDVQEGVVVVRMMGGCQGCGMANVTLRQGIEASLKRQIPTLVGIKDITDHEAGTNPYFSAGTK